MQKTIKTEDFQSSKIFWKRSNKQFHLFGPIFLIIADFSENIIEKIKKKILFTG